MFSDYISFAANNLRRRGLRSWLTLLGIIIGIAAVISFISLGNGLEQAITGQFTSLSTDRLVVTNIETGLGPPGSTVVKKLGEHDKEIIEKVTGVSSVISRLIRPVKVEYNKVAEFTFLGSLPDKKDQLNYFYNAFQLKADSGRLINLESRGSILIGSDLRKNNHFNKELRVGSKIKIQGKEFEIGGILKSSGSIQFNNAIFMQEEEVRKLFNIKDESDLLIVQVQDKDRIEEVAKEITRKLRKDRELREGEEDFSVQTPIQVLGTVNTILSVIQFVVAGIAAVSLLIGAVGVTNTMFTSVVERTKEIGIMKSIGAKNRDIFLIFLVESTILGLAGGIIGAFLGLFMAFIASNAANVALGSSLFTISLNLPLIFSAILFSLTIGICAGVVPAVQASRLNPVEALRK